MKAELALDIRDLGSTSCTTGNAGDTRGDVGRANRPQQHEQRGRRVEFMSNGDADGDARAAERRTEAAFEAALHQETARLSQASVCDASHDGAHARNGNYRRKTQLW